jgi:hypothetical protein
VEPEFVNGDATFVFELVGPFAAMFILNVFPFRANTFFKEVVVRFESKFGGWGDVVLGSSVSYVCKGAREWDAYVDTPEFLYRVKCHYVLQQVVPVIGLARCC